MPKLGSSRNGVEAHLNITQAKYYAVIKSNHLHINTSLARSKQKYEGNEQTSKLTFM